MEYDKPYKSFAELVDVLVHKHGMMPVDTAFAENVLIGTSYYDLVNGYKSHFMRNDQFLPGISFEHLYWFHLFDRGFQNVLFEASIFIEDYFKNVLAHTLAKNFGVDTSEYLAPDNFIPFRGRGKKGTSRKRLLEELRIQYEHPRDNPTLYYLNHHNHIPPWILLKNISFSDSIKLFSLLKRTEKQEILQLMQLSSIPYQDGVQILEYVLTMIRKCRNAIAHGLKFTEFNAARYGKNLNKKALRQLIPAALLTDEELYKKDLHYGVYGYILFSVLLMRNPFEKVLFSGRLIDYMIPKMKKDSPAAIIWSRLSIEYLGILGIPYTFGNRLSIYLSTVHTQKAGQR